GSSEAAPPPEPSGSSEAAPTVPAEPPAPASAPGKAESGTFEDVAWRLLAFRDEDPGDDNPLTYRERSYYVPRGTEPLVAEALGRDRVEALMGDLDDRPPGKFVNVAIFDHEWSEHPLRPPLVTAQLKDWVGDLVVERSLQTEPPAAVESINSPVVPESRPRRTTNEQDQRLADAFEACQDLFFLDSPLDALQFASDLFETLLPTERFSASLYDIDADVLRVAVTRGPGAETRRGQAYPVRGLLGTAARALGGALRVEDAASDDRYDAEVDGTPAPGPGLLLSLAHHGRLLGVITLYDRLRGGEFSQADTDLAIYVSEQLTAFLNEKRVQLSR
ncbi:MAG: GAF domain-containing protein, partial [Myxococcota bacterium]